MPIIELFTIFERILVTFIQTIMKKLFLSLLLFTFTMHSQTTINYLPIDDTGVNSIKNPERGYYYPLSTRQSSYIAGTSNVYIKLRSQQLDTIQTNNPGISLIQRNVRLDDFKIENSISPLFLTNLEDDLVLLRSKGLKCILRFFYSHYSSYPTTPPLNVYEPTESILIGVPANKPKALTPGHINQLASVTTRYTDVISSIEAGFIGNHGEWNRTTNFGYDDDGIILNPAELDTRKRVGNKIMELAPDRMVAFRTPRFQMLMMGQISSTVPTLPGINTRIAAHNDCFLSTNDDMGTYGTGGASIPFDQDFLQGQSINTFDGGETCSSGANSTGSNALIQMCRFHFNNLDVLWKDTVIANWRSTFVPPSNTTSYFDEIRKKLGYRFVLSTSTVSSNTVKIELKNLGFANVFNQRKAYLVLKNASNAVVTKVELTTSSGGDVRSWSAGSTTVIGGVVTTTPANLITLEKNLNGYVCPGTYSLFLELPDFNRASNDTSPKYSVRLANSNNGSTSFWEANTGFNNLYQTINITAPPIPTITGSVSACTASNLTYQTTNSTTLLPGQTANWTIEPPINGIFVNGSNTTTTAIVNWATLPATLRLTVTLPGGCTTTTTKIITSNCCDCLNVEGGFSLYAQDFTPPATTSRACISPTPSCGSLNLRYTWKTYSNTYDINYSSCSNLYPYNRLPVGCKIEILDSNNIVICTSPPIGNFPANRLKENTNIHSVNISPNPSTGNYNIKIENYVGELNIKVYDLNGRLVYDEKENKFDNETMIDLSHFQSGMYLLKIEGENINYSQKVIKN